MTLLLTGSSGFLGRYILKNIDKNKFNNIICIIHSDKNFKEYQFLFENCKIYKGSIYNKEFLNKIFNENKIEYVIHSAANKYIDICEKEKLDCINTNIIGTLNLCELSKKYNIKNLITISTDKANNPISFYGISKLASENITLSYGFSVYQGVNFLNSDGSFLPKWINSIKFNKPVELYGEKYIRYFSKPDETAKEILNLIINGKNKIYYPEYCYKIKIIDVFNILKSKFKNNKFIINEQNLVSYDKLEEIIDSSIKIKELEFNQLQDLIYRLLI